MYGARTKSQNFKFAANKTTEICCEIFQKPDSQVLLFISEVDDGLWRAAVFVDFKIDEKIPARCVAGPCNGDTDTEVLRQLYTEASLQAAGAVHGGLTDHCKIWDLILDPEYLRTIESEGARPLLLGADLQHLVQGSKVNDLVVALRFVWPKNKTPTCETGHNLADAGNARGQPGCKVTARIHKKYTPDQKERDQKHLQDLLSALRSPDYCSETREVAFPGFKLNIGVTRPRLFGNLERLVLDEESHRTWLLYHESPSHLRPAKAQWSDDRGILTIRDESSGRNVARFYECPFI